MNKVTLHGVEYNLPCHVVSLGLDMQCHHVVTQSTILSVNAAEDKVIIESEGIKIRLRMNDLKDFYTDTKENRDKLEAQCRKEYIEWKEAVRKQMETCSRRCGT
jgi:hypothetical protein